MFSKFRKSPKRVILRPAARRLILGARKGKTEVPPAAHGPMALPSGKREPERRCNSTDRGSGAPPPPLGPERNSRRVRTPEQVSRRKEKTRAKQTHHNGSSHGSCPTMRSSYRNAAPGSVSHNSNKKAVTQGARALKERTAARSTWASSSRRSGCRD